LGRTSEAFRAIGGVFMGGELSAATPGTIHVKARTTTVSKITERVNNL
jgi:hypothetical protein